MSRSAHGARRFIRVVGRLVPARHRDEWYAEWEGELEALLDAREREERGRGSSLPGVWAFVLGSLPHALSMWMEAWSMGGVVRDVRYACRVLLRAPVFSGVAAVTLAIGIGANASIVSLANGLVLRHPPGVLDADALVQVARSYEDAPRWDNWSWPAFEEIGRSSRVFADVAGYASGSFVIGEGASAEVVVGEYVSGGYFGLLGVGPAAGRLIQRADNVTPGAHPVVVLGHDLWTRRFGADPGVLGSTLSVGGRRYEIVGVAPRGFTGIETVRSPSRIFVPAMMYGGVDTAPFEAWGLSWFEVVARLAPGESIEAARAEMELVAERLRAASEQNEGIEVLLARGVGMSPDERVEARSLLLLLSGIGLLVLVLTVANVANLFVARSSARSGEIAVRLAIGAGRSRIARQVAAESVVVALAAVVVAVPMVVASADALPSLIPYPLSVSFATDARVLAALLAFGVAAGLGIGVLQSTVALRRGLGVQLRRAGSTGATGRTRARDTLVVIQMALSLALVTGSALLGRSALNARSADPGFQPRGVVVGLLNPKLTGRYEDEELSDLYRRIIREAAQLAGVDGATIASQAPFLGPFSRQTSSPADHPDPESVRVEAEAVFVGPDYFDVMGIPVVEGRALRAPWEEPEPVAVINETLAARFWPGEGAIGKQLAGPTDPTTVVGVVGDIRSRSLRERARPTVYEPLDRAFNDWAVLHVRTSRPLAPMLGAVRETVARVDDAIPFTGVSHLQQRMEGSLGETRTLIGAVAAFAGLALLLSAVGLYGLVSYGVSRRTREFGVRIALGAGPSRVVRSVVGRGAALAVVGCGFGLLLSLGVGRALESLLFGIAPGSPSTLALATSVLLTVAVSAAWLPARKASRVDAVEALRE